jgi:phosphatidylethanolamine-binding protein (PEBP) family uncharacterized protein
MYLLVTFNHWLLGDIPSGVHLIPQHYQAARPVHSFHLYALDSPSLALSKGTHWKEVDHAIKRHQLDVTEYMGLFQRK